MNAVVRRIARDDASALEAMHRVVCSVGFTSSIEKLRSNWLDSSPDTVCYGAYVDDRLVGINLFIAHTVLLANVRSKAYQGGWSALEPAYRDSRIPMLVTLQARNEFKREGACLIFGFPNAEVAPIYARLMKFKTVPMCRSFYLATGPAALTNLQFNANKYFDEVSLDNVVKFDQHQNFAWKLHEHDDLVSVEYYDNFIWGHVARQRVRSGVSVPVFVVGGCEINRPQLFGDLLVQVRKIHKVVLVRFTTTVDSLIASASRIVLDGSNTEPLIYLPLAKLPDDLRFDVHTGLKDAF